LKILISLPYTKIKIPCCNSKFVNQRLQSIVIARSVGDDPPMLEPSLGAFESAKAHSVKAEAINSLPQSPWIASLRSR
jgi:hypothetical protein